MCSSQSIAEIWKVICQNEGYFRQFNGAAYEEAMHLALARVASSRNYDYEDITPYIKTLARVELRQARKEIPCSIIDEESGEVAKPYVGLLDNSMSAVNYDIVKRLKEQLTDFYLEYPEDMEALRPVLENPTLELSKSKIKELKCKNVDLCNMITACRDRIGGDTVYVAITEFYNDLAKSKEIDNPREYTKDITLKAANFSAAAKFSKEPTILMRSGKYANTPVGIKRETLEMDKPVNLDCEKWCIIAQSKCPVYKIDITPYMEYIDMNLPIDLEEKQVDTKLIMWLGGRYRATTPGNDVHLNMEIDKFYELCRRELILNLVESGVNNIIGITPDTIYVKVTRKINYSNIRLHLFDNKIIQLSVSLYDKLATAPLARKSR
jgi:hypothetical protein